MTFIPKLRFILFITLFLTGTFLYAQSPTISWQKCFGGSRSEKAFSIIQADVGNILISGYSRSDNGNLNSNNGDDDSWFFLVDPLGNILWNQHYGGEYCDWSHSVTKTNDNGFFAGGLTYSFTGDVSGNHGQCDFWVLKLNTIGEIQWQKCYGGSSYDYCQQVLQTFDGGYIAAGYTQSENGNVTGNHGQTDCWIIKLDSMGNLDWQKCYGGSSFDMCYSIQEIQGDGYVFAGFTLSNDGDVDGNHGGIDGWIAKISLSGELIWQKCIGGSSDDRIYSMKSLPGNGLVMSGLTSSINGDVSNNHGANDYWVVKLSESGEIEWQGCFGGSIDDRALDVDLTDDGGFIVSGYSNSTNGDVTGHHGGYDYWIIKLSETGELEWEKCLGGSQDDDATSVLEVSSGQYIVAGGTWSNDGDVSGNHGDEDQWIIQLKTELGTSEKQTSTYSIDISPNPCSGSTKLIITSTEYGLMILDLYEISGIRIKRLLNEEKTPGTYEMEIDLSDLPKGIYFCALKTSEGINTKKVIKL